MLALCQVKELVAMRLHMPSRIIAHNARDIDSNEGSVVQCHSQENDAFKSDRVVIGSGVTVGVDWTKPGEEALKDYKKGDTAKAVVLEADSFLLKGGETPPNTRWGGNPACELGSARQGS